MAANRAVEHAEAGDSDVKELALNLSAGVTGVAARVALTGVAGPVGASIAGVVVTTVLNKLFESDPPSQADLEDAFADRLRAAGIEVAAGERGYDDVSEVYRELQTALTTQLADPNLTQEQRNAVQLQIEVAQGVLNGLVTYGDTIDSEGGAAGDINGVLNDRDDEP